MRFNTLLIPLFLVFFNIWSVVVAGPTVIQDNRITNLATTPNLGRGYTISTNTFQSLCLADVKMTEPSYDMLYTFKDMKDVLSQTGSETNTLTKIATTGFRNYMVKKEYDEQQKKGTEKTTSTKRKETQTLIAEIKLHSYYASVDESQSRLSQSAAKLLTSNDIPGFFHSCGSYYVRSIGRQAVFYAVFEFEKINETEDKDFTYQLTTQLKSFRKKVVTTSKTSGWWWWRRRATKRKETWDETVSDQQSYGQNEDKFQKATEKRNLTITVAAFGLGKNEKATLVSYDIETFKAAIKDAFLSMQNPNTGKVISIEVVPWVENTDFQSLTKLDEEEEISKSVIVDGKEVGKKVTKLLLYEKKQILSSNAEFLAELEKADRGLMNLYYKAKMCKKQIIANYKTAGGGKKSWRREFINRYVMNNRYQKSGIKLDVLDAYLSKSKLKGLIENQRQFMYGGGSFGAGAKTCIRNLMDEGIYKKSYRELSACTTLQENFDILEDELIENHCMPRLFKAGFVPREVTATTTEGPLTQ